jgi:cardiolipin synthase
MSETAWQFYLTGQEAWSAMLADLVKAERSIELEQFIFLADQAGQPFVELLAAKAAAGISVRILVDYVGSFSFVNSKTAAKLSQAGVKIAYYNPIKPWRLDNFTAWFWRDHRKILLIDREIAYTGGLGIAASMTDWRDTVVRLEGAVIAEISYVFERMWQITAEGRFRRFRLERHSRAPFRFWSNSPHFRQRFFYRRLTRAISRAKNHIYLTTPYFIPSQRLLFLLVRAARRGVDVRLITPEHSDHPLVDLARNSYYALALAAGLRIYHFQGRIMHAKTVVIDDYWSSVGSANLDNLSLLFNYEANLVSEDRSFAATIKEQFVNDMLAAKKIEPEEWRQRSWLAKVLEIATWPFHGLL